MKLKHFFADSFMNCIMIVLIMLYSSTILLYQKPETGDEEPSIAMVASWLQMKELLAWTGTCHSGSKFGPILLPIFVKM